MTTPGRNQSQLRMLEVRVCCQEVEEGRIIIPSSLLVKLDTCQFHSPLSGMYVDVKYAF